MSTTKLRKVVYHHYQPGVANANILWEGKFPMRKGKFPSNHPVGGPIVPDGQMEDNPAMQAFRTRGYWASCFPEGDGMTVKPLKEQTAGHVAMDIKDCFGWDVDIE